MVGTPTELLLPLSDDATAARDLNGGRWSHLQSIPGVEPAAAQRLARAFPSLAAIYAADEERLVRVVGPVVASRIRWFLDAPLDSGLTLAGVIRARAA